MAGENVSFVISAIDQFTQTFANLNRQQEQAAQAATVMGAGFVVAGAAASAGLGFAVKTAADFESQMSRVGAISGATGDQMGQLRDTALELGATTSKSASEAAIGMENLASKGFEVNEIMAAMPGIIAASEASGEDMAMTSDVVASALNAWHMEASKAGNVADVLAMAANKSSAGIQDMGYAFKYAAPVANVLGISMEELAAATGVMTDSGLAGEQAGTALRASLLRLSDPPEAAANALIAMGISVTDAQGNFKDLSPLIGEFAAGMEGMTDAQKAATAAQLFGTEAASGMLAVIGNGQANFDKFVGSLENSEGSAAATAAVMKDNLKGALDELGGSFETLKITMGTHFIPIIQTLAQKLGELANWYNNLSPAMQKMISFSLLIGVGLGLLVGKFLLLMGVIPTMISSFAGIASTLGLTAGAFAAIIGWVLLAIAAIVGIGIGLYIAYQKIEWFRNAVNSAWAAIKGYWNTAVAFVKDITTKVIGAVAKFIQNTLNDIKEFWAENGVAITQLLKVAWAVIKGIISVGLSGIMMVFRTVFPIIVGIVKVAWAVIQAVFSTVMNVIMGIISFWAKLLTGDVKGAMTTVKNTFKNIWDDIVRIFKGINLVQIGKDIVNGLVKGITGMAGAVGKAVKGIASAIPAKIKSFLGIHSPSRVLMELGGFTGEGFANGIGSMVGQVTKATSDIAAAAIPSLRNPEFSAVQRTGNVADVTSKQQKSGPVTQQSAEYTFEIPVIIDGRQVAKATARFTKDELDRIEAGKKRAKGVR